MLRYMDVEEQEGAKNEHGAETLMQHSMEKRTVIVPSDHNGSKPFGF